MKKVGAWALSIIAAAVVVSAPASPASAGPSWDHRIMCQKTDPDGRVIPTRLGNSELGWRHLSAKHNIRNCGIINAALGGRVDEKNGDRLVYWGDVVNGRRHVSVRVVVQYAQRTADGRYDAGPGGKIGVVTAFCVGANVCPNWING